ncbi:MAG: hypothetical protein DI569_10545 [Sphingopyxis macrogoltabida]|uniref:Uncharacterized protein n=1 Tax=Sphingopyxis macrogoltabida TaxID=33050 RepID=A0A2W5KXX1_SPHMC|nr:MAG: hypothetical protein DI569_10545 [Sphingopyxis macrogoltabida]
MGAPWREPGQKESGQRLSLSDRQRDDGIDVAAIVIPEDVGDDPLPCPMRHCEERSDEAISSDRQGGTMAGDCFPRLSPGSQ